MMLLRCAAVSCLLMCLKELASARRCCSREVLREAGRQVLWTVEDMVGDMEEDMVEDLVVLSVGCTVPLHWKGGVEGVHWVQEPHVCTSYQDLLDTWRIYPAIHILIVWH